MKDFLLILLQAVLVAATPVLTAFICQLINKAASWFTTKIKNQRANKYLLEIADIVATGVAYASQTYVDALKKDGKFDVSEQKEAFALAYKTIEGLLTEGAKNFITETYGDLNAFLTAKIEATVHDQK
ncbi:MAG: hypothetical protein J5597_04720 [Spirochaetaceae bacterium]|nr:hypothetical protein [Spirochaetaceae bacterium]